MIVNLEVKYKSKFPPSSTVKVVRFVEDGSDIKRRLHIFYHQYCPAKISTVPHILDKYRGDEERMILLLERKYNAQFPPALSYGRDDKKLESSKLLSPLSASKGVVAQFPSSMTWLEANLRLFLQKHDPENLQQVHKYLKAYKGRETDMVEFLERKYNAWFPQL
jgi:hypothetical protein